MYFDLVFLEGFVVLGNGGHDPAAIALLKGKVNGLLFLFSSEKKKWEQWRSQLLLLKVERGTVNSIYGPNQCCGAGAETIKPFSAPASLL